MNKEEIKDTSIYHASDEKTGVRTCPVCPTTTDENVSTFDTAEQRWIHYADNHPDFVNEKIDDDLTSFEGYTKFLLMEIKPRVEFFEENYPNKFPQNQILLTKIKDSLGNHIK